MSDRLTGYLCLTLAMMTVGATVTASKIIACGMAPFTATALRFAVALPVCALVLLAVRPALPRLPARIWGLLLVQAGAGSVGYTVLLIAGLSHMPSADAGVLIGTLPAVAALFSVLVLGERPGRGLWAALGLATLGVAAVTWSGPPQVGLGAALVMGAVACESVFILLNKRFGTPLPPLWQATVMTALGLLVAAPFALLEGRPVAPEALGAVVFYALVPTVGGFLLWYAGAARVSGAEAALFTAAAPVTAVALAALWLGEAVGPAQIAGMAAVVLALLLIARFPPEEPDRCSATAARSAATFPCCARLLLVQGGTGRTPPPATPRRLRLPGDLPRLHPLVDFGKAVPAAHAIPLATFDLDRIRGTLTVAPAKGTETQDRFDGGQACPEPSEVICAGEAGTAHARRWVHRQGALSAVKPRTRRALVVAEALHGGAAADLARMSAALSEGLRAAGGTVTSDVA